MTAEFDFSQALKELQSGKNLTGTDGVLMPLIKRLSEAALASELNHHLKESPSQANRKNGTMSKRIKTGAGSFKLNAPRDRAGSFEPQFIAKNQTVLTPEMDQKILSMYALGMGYRDIKQHLHEIYGVEVATGKISAVTDALIAELEQWQQRPLERVYPIVWLDAIHYKVRESGRYTQKAIYTLLGLDSEGKKEILGLYLSDSEGAKHWLSVLTELQNRGVEDILIACIDGLSGFVEAIEAVFPKTEVQLCIIHQIRNSMKYVGSKNQKEFMVDLKRVYQAASLDIAENELDSLENKWGDQYPIVIRSWRKKWANLSAYFKYPQAIRRIIYTTNAVEAVHRQFRKLTKTKGAFPNDNSLLKLLYAGILNAQKKWTMPIQNWAQALSALAIYFDGRLDGVIDI